jgi:signal transduction histidine kinase
MFRQSVHDRQLLDVNKIVRDVLATLDIELRHQKVTVRTNLAGNVPRVLADSGQLHQVFLNLVTNAMEAMAAVPGRPSVLKISTAFVSASPDVVVTVEDIGVGIADGDSSRILEPFFSTKSTGTGVGLTICKVIVEAHGGSLQVSANKPYGTIVSVTLPKGGYD